MEKLISSLFFAAFLQRNFLCELSLCKRSAHKSIKVCLKKGFCAMHEFFSDLDLKYIKKAKKSLTIINDIIREEL